MTDSEQKNIGYLCIIRDTTHRHEMENQLRLAATAMEMAGAITITDPQHIILQVNKAFTEVTGYSKNEVIGQPISILQSGRQSKTFYKKMWKNLNETGQWDGEIWNKRKNGEIYPQWLTITRVCDNEGKVTHFIGNFTDITERKKAEEQIQYQAHYDSLTNLANRRLLQDRLKTAIAASQRHNWIGAILFLDLDHFKNINDSFGHPVGDALLVEVAQRLKNSVREEDTVARLGGDEFIVMLCQLSDKVDEAENKAEHLAQVIIENLTKQVNIESHQLHISTSIGITLFSDMNNNSDDILKYADLALYQAKNSGRNTYKIFETKMEKK